MELSNAKHSAQREAPARRLAQGRLGALAVITILLVLFHQLTLMPIRVVGISMEPTYRDGAFSLVNKLAYVRDRPGRGDIIAIRGEARGIFYMKRIVALPEETLSVAGGEFRIDGGRLMEPYTAEEVPWAIRGLQLGPDEYFVIGDNRPLTSFGVIKEEQIVGKVLF